MLIKCKHCEEELTLADDGRWKDGLGWCFICTDQDAVGAPRTSGIIQYHHLPRDTVDDLDSPHAPDIDDLCVLAIEASRMGA